MIAFRGAQKAWTGGVSVGPLDLSIEEGQFVALIGGSGSGKTTTLKMVNRLVALTAGEVWVEGKNAALRPAHLLRRSIGYVFQEIGLFPHLLAGENIAVGPRLAGWSKDRTSTRLGELLEMMNLPADLAARRPAELSGGQRQRVGLARAIAANPRIVLMDEPFGALDPMIREALAADYKSLHERLGLTTVMVTHDLVEALLLADRIVVMETGRIVVDAAPGELLDPAYAGAARPLLDARRRQEDRLSALAMGEEP